MGILYSGVLALVVGIAQILITELLLGLTGLLYPGVLILVNMLFLSLIFCRWVRPNVRKLIDGHRIAWAKERQRKKSIFAIGMLALLFGITCWNLFWGWFLPGREYDGLAYHLPIMAAFFQAHAIFPISTPSVWIRYYPINSELLELWSLSIVGIDKLVDWSFVPCFFGGVASIYGVACRLGARRTHALAGAAVMAFSTGMLTLQVGTMNDGLFASFVAMGVFMAIGGQSVGDASPAERKNIAILGAAICVGVLFGMKFTGVLYGFGLLVFLWFRWSRFGRSAWDLKQPVESWPRRSRVFMTAVVLVFVLGAYPYLRNLAVAGNPLAPFEVQIGGWTIFPGDKNVSDYTDVEAPGDKVTRTIAVWFEPYQNVFDRTLAGMGPLWVVLGVPSCLAWVAWCLYRRNWPHLVFAGILVGCFLLTPDFWYPRYALPLLLLGGVATAVILEKLNAIPRFLLLSLIMIFSVFNVGNVLAPYALKPEFIERILFDQDDRTRSSAQFILTSNGQHAYEWIDQETLDHPACIAFGKLIRFPYSLYGADLRNTVLLTRPGNEGEFSESLRQNAVDIVIVLKSTFYYQWMTDQSEYTEVFKDGDFIIFQKST
jgi:hypothetical protein